MCGDATSRERHQRTGVGVALGRMRDAIATSLEQFPDALTNPAGCPTAAQLCQMAGDFEQLRNLARSRGDLLSFAAGVIQGS